MEQVREKIDKIFDDCYSQDLSVCPKHPIFQRGKAANEILALFPDEEDELKVVGMIRKQERERIRDGLADCFSDGKVLWNVLEDYWQALKEEK